MYTVRLSKGTSTVTVITTSESRVNFTNLLPLIQYQISVQQNSCPQKGNYTTAVWTTARVFAAQIRVTNQEYKPGYGNKNDPAFQDFEKNFVIELLKFLSALLQNLINSGQMRVVLISLKAGSVIVDYEIVTNVNDNFTVANVAADFTDALNQSTALIIDPKSYVFQAQNSCSADLNGCSENAACTSIYGTYTCQCFAGFNDTSPDVPGRLCQDINECVSGNNNCSQLASCANTVGSYECQCYTGINDQNATNPGRDCLDPVTCYSAATFCNKNFTCINSKANICSNTQAFPCSVLMKDKSFTTDLYNPSSASYINLSSFFTVNLTNHMKTKLSVSSFQIILVGFRPGSVNAHFMAVTNSSTPISSSALQEALTSGVQDLSKDATVIVTPAIITVPEAQDYSWRTATIVIAVLLGAFLLIVVILSALWIYTKNRVGKFSPEKSSVAFSAYKHL
ncbi:uncharacterized protein LOC142139577 isoform X2 [Mixophyes fleayi]